MASLGLLCSCIYDDYPDEAAAEQKTAWLVLHVGMVSPTRANGADNNREAMHSLRVILMDEAGRVEYNGHIDKDSYSFGDNGLTELDYGQTYPIRTTLGKKKIYLIANEESVTAVESTKGFAGTSFSNDNPPTLSALLNTLTADDEDSAPGSGNGGGNAGAGAEALLNSIYFTPENYGEGNIPLSSYYEFSIEEADLGSSGNRRLEKTFYLVHAATKFEFRFENYRPNPVAVDQLALSSIADKMYLMAQVGETDQTKKLPDGTEKYWIDWLKVVSDDTTLHPDLTGDPSTDNKDINAKYGWITDYSLPDESNINAPSHQEKTIVDKDQNIGGDWTIPAATTNNTANNLTPGKLEDLPVIYFPESKFNETTNGDETRQNYILSITVTDQTLSEDQSKKFPSVPLENLKALFRNTHVIVTVTIRNKEDEINLELKIGICPWNKETIDIPAFD